MIKAHSEFIDDNPNFKYYPMLIKKATFGNNALPLIIMNNSNIKVCIPKEIAIGTSEDIDNDHYRINEITLTAKSDDKPVKSLGSSTQKKPPVNAQIDHASVITYNNDNTPQHSSTKSKDAKQLPNPLTSSNVITSPAEITDTSFSQANR